MTAKQMRDGVYDAVEAYLRANGDGVVATALIAQVFGEVLAAMSGTSERLGLNLLNFNRGVDMVASNGALEIAVARVVDDKPPTDPAADPGLN